MEFEAFKIQQEIQNLENRMLRRQPNPIRLHQKDEIRRGDWICLVCHNHNFSFRKFCNRCENQSRRDNEVQTSMLRRRIDMQMNMELEASYNTFPKAVFLTLREENTAKGQPIKIPSLSFIEETEQQDNDHCKWVRSMLEDDQSDKENYFCKGLIEPACGIQVLAAAAGYC